jgi:hypothetical protein
MTPDSLAMCIYIASLIVTDLLFVGETKADAAD